MTYTTKDKVIVTYIKKQGDVSLKELSEIFGVTDVTCRNYITYYLNNKKPYNNKALRTSKETVKQWEKQDA